MFERLQEKIIHIGDKDYSMDDLLVVIPEQYSEMFRKIRFNNMSEFSRALMFARCADEAKDRHRSDLQKENEAALNWFVNNRPLTIAENFYCGSTEFFLYYGEGQYHIDEKVYDDFGDEEYKCIFEGTYKECLEYKNKLKTQYAESLF